MIMARSLKLRLTDEFDDVRSKVMRDPRTREELLDRDWETVYLIFFLFS